MDTINYNLMNIDALIQSAVANAIATDEDADISKVAVNSVLAGLNPEQHQVATTLSGITQVIACAGSGKTHALTARLMYMLSEGIPSSEILMFTFTNAAADEMKARANRVSPLAGAVTACTFHSLCYDIVSSVDPQATIKDTNEIITLMSYIKGLNPNMKVKGMPSAKVLVSINSYMFNTRSDIQTALQSNKSWEKYDTPEMIQAIEGMLNLYKTYMRQGHFYDYDMLLEYGCAHIKSGAWKSPFKHIMVDEYQDTNPVQADIIDALLPTATSLVVVGDDFQSIYGFRGSDINQFLDFRTKYPQANLIVLDTNYRSNQGVLNTPNEVMNAAYAEDTGIINREMHAANGVAGENTQVITVDDQDVETNIVMREIEKDIAENRSVGVLYRKSASSYALEVALRKKDIEFNKLGGVKFMDKVAVQDMLAFYKLTYNVYDFLSLYRILKQFPNINDIRASRIADHVKVAGLGGLVSTEFASQHTQTATDIQAHLTKLHEWLTWLSNMSFYAANADMVAQTYDKVFEYYDYIRKEAIERGRIDDDKKQDAFDEWEGEKSDVKENLRLILSDAEDLKEFVLSSGLSSIKDDKDMLVTLSTIHSSKGLEWDSVYILDAVTEAFLNEPEEDDDIRCFYVGVTRGRSRVWLIQPNVICLYGKTTQATPLRWLEETPNRVWDERVL